MCAPIAVGNVLRQLPTKCACFMFHSKAAEFFQLCQYGIACLGGVEKIIQCLTHCVDTHQYHPGFAVLKINL